MAEQITQSDSGKVFLSDAELKTVGLVVPDDIHLPGTSQWAFVELTEQAKESGVKKSVLEFALVEYDANAKIINDSIDAWENEIEKII